MKTLSETKLYKAVFRHFAPLVSSKKGKNTTLDTAFLIETFYNNKENYVSFVCKGDFVFDKFVNEFDKLADFCHKNNCRNLLFDMSGLNSPLPDWDRFKTGEAIADKLMGIKLASFSKASFTNGFTINVAFNRGMDIKVFTDLEEALKWLLG